MKKQMKTAGIGFYILILAIIFFAVYVSGALDNKTTIIISQPSPYTG